MATGQYDTGTLVGRKAVFTPVGAGEVVPDTQDGKGYLYVRENGNWVTKMGSVENDLVTESYLGAEFNYHLPVGSIVIWPGAAAPNGWLLCNGQLVDREDYPALFAVCGTTYNFSGEDATNFRVPYLIEGYEPKGAGAAPYLRGSFGGASAVALTTTHLPLHNHAFPNPIQLQATAIDSTGANGTTLENSGTSVAQGHSSGRFMHPTVTTGTNNVGNAGSGVGFSIQNLYQAMYYIIRAG